MPPARPRNVDDSRSETSSTIANQKEKPPLGPTSGSGVSKGKRLTSNLNGSSGASKALVNGVAIPAPPTATDGEKDPNLPRVCSFHPAKNHSEPWIALTLTTPSPFQTEWTTMPTPILRSYRIAHRLSVPPAFNQPHAEVTYRSSEIALRAPSAVHYRRKLRGQQHHRRKLRRAPTNGLGKSNTSREQEKGKSKHSNPNKPPTVDLSIAQSIEPPDHAPDPDHPPSSPSSSVTTYLGPREPTSHLANAVRKHFNAQQLSEADTIARFIYVVQQNGRAVRTEGSRGDGSGHWMGSQGREVRRNDGPGGETGFRLRFRP